MDLFNGILTTTVQLTVIPQNAAEILQLQIKWQIPQLS